ncbi:E3 ubiquitin ligase RBR family [Trema orientale]|uniref:RBR-type E3 ubiquitin transferase n=1 Tax=Trema orientale TaxID=63057 RepID=A0A2P5FZH1_TREOI|nr:E3 ubiquitin ligase RBR family [Trema orientale]
MGDFIDSDDDYFDHDSDDDPELPEIDDQGPNEGSVKGNYKRVSLGCAREDLRKVMEVLSLKEHHARTLLIHYRWDVDKLLTVLVEKGKDDLCAKAGVTSGEHDNFVPSKFSSMVMCIVCIEEVPANEVTTMDCGHYFCNSCWTEHFIVKINEGQSKRIRCMEHQCQAICDEAKVRILVNARDPKLAEKFDRFLLESYIEDNRKVKWCPSVPHCGNAIRVDDVELCEVECACGLQFCFSCSSEAHSPCSCLMWELWSKKCRDDSETVNWITVHSKPCPKCHKSVEKNGGCNLVICVCGQAFCWLCGGATGREHTYASIAGHSCGRYKEEKVQKAEHAKRDLLRYIHYHNRYKAHTDSFELETNLKTTIQEKISRLEERESTNKDFSWVTDGLYRLFRSRRILSYSYPFAFYMFGDERFNNQMTKEEREIKKNLFEDQQQQFEANVEKLSSILEEPFDQFSEDKVVKLRMDIINLSTVTDKLCGKLYECIENELLGTLQWSTRNIAPYKSKGVDKASELIVCTDMKLYHTEKDSSKDGMCIITHMPITCVLNLLYVRIYFLFFFPNIVFVEEKLEINNTNKSLKSY